MNHVLAVAKLAKVLQQSIAHSAYQIIIEKSLQISVNNAIQIVYHAHRNYQLIA